MQCLENTVIPSTLNAEQSVIQRSFVDVHNYIVKNRGGVQSVLLHNGGFYENFITLFCLEKNKLFDNIKLAQNLVMHITQSG
jgi:hypothetical protein